MQISPRFNYEKPLSRLEGQLAVMDGRLWQSINSSNAGPAIKAIQDNALVRHQELLTLPYVHAQL